MSLLIPLGLLGLLGLAALILIYILKPNYQQKMVSSTFVWKLSLKYKKKRIPVSRLRNFLILLCQILVICCAAMILAKPVIVTSSAETINEEVIIIDASADMFAEYEGRSRFEKAVENALTEASAVFENDGYVTVIWAGNNASFIVRRADKTLWNDVQDELLSLECSYGVADIDAAMFLAEEVLKVNPDAEVVLFTGTHYSNEGKNVRVEYVSDDGEWNVAILDASAELEDNYYVFTVDVACYGTDRPFDIICELTEVNGTSDSATLPVKTVNTFNDETITVIYSIDSGIDSSNTVYVSLDNQRIYSFNEMYIHIDEADSIVTDNEYFLYGYLRPTIKVEYYSTSSSPFYSSILTVLRQSLVSEWNIEVTEIRGGTPEIEGYDFYLFENAMPEALPKDGVVLMANPDSSAGAGFTIGRTVTISNTSGDGAALAPGIEHPIMEYVDVSYFNVTQYTQVDESSLDGYDVLMYYEGNPVFFVRNEVDSKIGVIMFSTRMSNFNISFFYAMLMRNFFDFYFPTTFENRTYNVYDSVDLTARGSQLEVLYDNVPVMQPELNTAELYFDKPGTYTIRQLLISGVYQEEKIYVTIPASESNITKTEDVLTNPYIEKVDKFTYDDLLMYFALALVILLFLERLLQTREGI